MAAQGACRSGRVGRSMAKFLPNCAGIDRYNAAQLFCPLNASMGEGVTVDRFLLIAVCWMLCGSAFALELRSQKLGSSEQQLLAQYPNLDCHTTGGPAAAVADRRCDVSYVTRAKSGADYMLVLADEPVLMTTWHFFDDRLGKLSFWMGTGSFEQVLAAMREKFGRESNYRRVPVQNLMGAKFTNEIAQWKRGDEAIEIERYSDDLDHMMVSLHSIGYLREAARRERDLGKRGAKRL